MAGLLWAYGLDRAFKSAADFGNLLPMKTPIILRFCFLSIFLLGFAWSSLSWAEESVAKEPTAFEKALMMNENVSTKETIVQMGSRKFRKVEFKNDVYYLGLLSDLNSAADLLVLCNEKQAAVFNRESPPLVSAAVRVAKRTRFFIEGLKTMCMGSGNQKRIDLVPEIAIGFLFDDSPDPSAIFKNRRILINPLGLGVGFSADW